MCGIVGYIGQGNIPAILVEGLKRLEYRGYDSAGICLHTDESLVTIKRKGRIAELEKALNTRMEAHFAGIAHTRWATHGGPSEVNSHPHSDCSGDITLVHNAELLT